MEIRRYLKKRKGKKAFYAISRYKYIDLVKK